jgi:hypothetical protein
MKRVSFGAAMVAVALTGCTVTNGSSLDAAFDRLEKGVAVVSCRVARGSEIAAKVQDAVDTGIAVKTATGAVYVASASVCVSLGGTLEPKKTTVTK